MGTGNLTLTALTGFARFLGTETFAADSEVLYAIENGDNKETGKGIIRAGNILERTTPFVTLVAGVYDASSPIAITLVGSSIVFCDINNPASATVSGFLASTDYATFIAKIGGSGTTNTIPKFTAAGTIGNSSRTDTGTAVTELLAVTLANLANALNSANYPLQFLSGVADGATAVGHIFNVTSTLNTVGAKAFDVRHSGSSILSIETRNSINRNTLVTRDPHTQPNNASRLYQQILKSDGTLALEIGSTAAAPHNTEIRFNDASATRIGFPATDPTYFAFINSVSEMWLGTVGDPSLYFNFYVGTNVNWGTQTNLQAATMFGSMAFTNSTVNNRGLAIAPNTVNGVAAQLTFKTNTPGFYLVNNKSIFFGTSSNSGITYNGTDIVFDSRLSGTGDYSFPTGVIKVGNLIRLKDYTVATLPAGTQGDKAFVTDALGPTYLVAVVGGGAVVTEVFRNATTWVCT